MQMTLDIPKINIKETRRALYAYLAVYRRYRQQLADGWEPVKKAPLPGYEKAMDPELIKKVGQKLGASSMTPEEYREAFCAMVEYKVHRLAPYGREIVIRRLLTPRKGYRTIHELPSDTEVLMAMKQDGWCAEKTYYDEQKAEAIQCLAESLDIAIHEGSMSRVFGEK